MQSKGLSRVFSNTTVQKHQFFTVQLSHPYMTTGKTIALSRQTFVGKVMSLLFNININSSSQLLPLPGNPHSCLGYVWLWQGLSVLIPFRLLQITCFTLSLKCFSSDSDSCPDLGIGPLLQFPHLPRTGPVLLTLLFSPYFLHPTKYGVVLYILFHSSSTLVHSQLVFCMHFCV